VSPRICIDDGSFQTNTYNQNCYEEAGYHNEQTHGVVILYKELSKALIYKTGMPKI